MEENGAATTVSADEFAALEAKVLQTVELIKREREARTTAEHERAEAMEELASAREQLRSQTEAAANAQRELELLHGERDAVRKRVEHMVQSMDELLR